MKGDFSRNTFNKKKHFASVRMQQGRVQLDADWNEQMDIIDNRIRVGSQDFIGGSGAPSGSPGYSITPTTAKTDLTIGAGRFYIQGVLVENEKAITYTEQTLPSADILSKFTQNGLYLAYLDSWQQGVSAVDDPSIEEPAFKGADTATRIKNVAQVKLKKLASDPGGLNLKCETVINNTPANKTKWQEAIATSTGKLSAKVSANANLENQLYRIEIHNGGNQSTATFKWSRDNGALMVAIQDITDTTITSSTSSNTTITLKSNVNKELNFSASQWVELSTRTRELQNRPGKFVLLSKVEDNRLTLASSLTPAEKNEFKNAGTVRQWNTKDKSTSVTDFFAISAVRNNNDVNITFTSNKPTNIATNLFVELKVNNNTTTQSLFSQIKSINGNTITVNNFAKTDAEIKELTLLRVVTSATTTVSGNGFIAIENGLEIKFEAGTYKTGDYWLLPTRAITNSIVSAQYGNFSTAQLPEGIQHYYAQLALVRRSGTATAPTWTLAGDCRTIISALANQAYQSASGTRTPSNSVYVAQDGKVGIGTNNPKSKLDVDGGVTIGAGYSGSNAAPSNGLLVEGNVGIGTHTPASQLDMGGNQGKKVFLQGEGYSIGTQDHGVYFRTLKNFAWYKNGVYNNGELNPGNGIVQMVIKDDKVGIGTNAPQSKLDVEGGVTIGASYSGNNAAPSNGLIVEGNVAIGKSTVSSGTKLEINGKTKTTNLEVTDGIKVKNLETQNLSFTGRLSTGGSVNNPGTSTPYPLAINNYYNINNQWGDSAFFLRNIYIQSGTVKTGSDRRIKEIVTIGEAKRDLKLLNQLNVIDYHYKEDKKYNDDGLKKGLIAQEVEQICPTAVKRQQEFVPNIYQLSKAVDINIVEKTALITLETVHDLAVSDKVKLINDKQEFIKTVKAIPNKKDFIIDDWHESDKEIFVYGKEVDDFRTLDYNQIFCLNISATQGLYKEVCTLTQRLQQQEQKVDTQNKKLQLNTRQIQSQNEQIQLLNKKLDELLAR